MNYQNNTDRAFIEQMVQSGAVNLKSALEMALDMMTLRQLRTFAIDMNDTLDNRTDQELRRSVEYINPRQHPQQLTFNAPMSFSEQHMDYESLLEPDSE